MISAGACCNQVFEVRGSDLFGKVLVGRFEDPPDLWVACVIVLVLYSVDSVCAACYIKENSFHVFRVFICVSFTSPGSCCKAVCACERIGVIRLWKGRQIP